MTASDGYEYRDALPHGLRLGRGAGINPGNRYESVRLHVAGEWLDSAADEGETRCDTQVFADRTRTIINRVDSPDLPFNWTINPYRGCEHGCAYCYARPDHERLGLSCGLDFETKIVAKLDAPKLLRRELAKPSWKGEPIAMSGVTDPYQPIESKLRITRGCLEVMAACGQPVSIVTKSRLVTRDIDLLAQLARHHAVRVSISITTLDRSLAMKMEPRASSPGDRLRAVRELRDAGIDTTVMVAPVVPGLTDREVPAILEAAADAGAMGADFIMLRLPHQLKAVLLDWLTRHFPDRAQRVERFVREMRGGALYDATYGCRQRGKGAMAEQAGAMFETFRRRYGLDGEVKPLSSDGFVRPQIGGQLDLFR